MPSHIFAVDASYYQNPVDDTYPRPWFIHRAFDGEFTDPRGAHNQAWSAAACKAGKMTGHTGYGVFEPGVDMLARFKDTIGTPDPWFTAMIDVERWGGKITGDHSAEINYHADRLAEWLGDRRRVLVYANLGDFEALFPEPDAWIHHVVAGYNGVDPTRGNVIGWQYTDGTMRWPVPDGWPRSTPPFGFCDHNVFNLTAEQLAAALGVSADGTTTTTTDGASATPITESDDLMALNPKDRADLIRDIVAAVWAHEQVPIGTTVPRRMDVANANGLVRALQAAEAAEAAAATVKSVAQVLGTPKTGVAARVATLQAAVDSLVEAVRAVDADVKTVGADVQAAPAQDVKLDSAAVSTAVVEAVQKLAWKAV